MVKKMALVPADLALQFQQHTPGAPTINQLSDLDTEMKTILDDGSMSTALKYKRYYNTLHRYEALKENTEQEPTPVTIHERPPPKVARESGYAPIDETEILETLPITQRRGARLLMKYIQRNPDLDWNGAREMVYKGTRVPNSNIFDLVSDMSRNRRNVTPPPGWEQFTAALMGANVPQNAVGNKRRWEYISRRYNGDASATPPAAATTPRRRRVRGSIFSEDGSADDGPSNGRRILKARRIRDPDQSGSGLKRVLKWEKLY